MIYNKGIPDTKPLNLSICSRNHESPGKNMFSCIEDEQTLSDHYSLCASTHSAPYLKCERLILFKVVRCSRTYTYNKHAKALLLILTTTRTLDDFVTSVSLYGALKRVFLNSLKCVTAFFDGCKDHTILVYDIATHRNYRSAQK